MKLRLKFGCEVVRPKPSYPCSARCVVPPHTAVFQLSGPSVLAAIIRDGAAAPVGSKNELSANRRSRIGNLLKNKKDDCPIIHKVTFLVMVMVVFASSCVDESWTLCPPRNCVSSVSRSSPL